MAQTPLFNDLLTSHQSGHALAQGFYASAEVFERDMEAVVMQEWHFAGLANEIAEAGAYMVFELLKESVIIVRGKDGNIRALANVCRHRGSRVCLEHRGTVSRFVWPYHAPRIAFQQKLNR